MVFNTTFNNIWVISWLSVLLVEETRENHRSVTSHWKTLSKWYCCTYKCMYSRCIFV